MKTLKNILYFTLATLVTSLLPASGILMPLFIILSAALLVAMSVKWNYIYSIFATAFSILINYIMSDFSAVNFAGIVYSSVIPLLSFISATGIYFALKAKLSVKSVLLSGTIGYFLLIAGIYFIFGSTIIADIINVIKAVMLESLDIVAISLPSGSTEVVAELKAAYETYFETLKVVAPSIILSLFFLLSYFTIKVSKRLAKNQSFYERIPSFSEVRAPAFLIIITAVAYTGQLSGNGFLAGLMANIFMVLSVYYTLCGFSLIDFFTKKRVNKLYVRILIYIAGILVLTLLSFIIYFANPILIAMFGGMIDSLFNYRAKAGNLTGK